MIERPGAQTGFVGVHVEAGTVRAIAVDAQGEIRARANGHTAAVTLASIADQGVAIDAVVIAAEEPEITCPLVAAAVGPGVTVTPLDLGAAVVLGEVAYGAARGLRHVVALTAGSSVRAGVLLDGRLWRGAHGLAGSAAWLALNPVEREDYRRHGCLQSEISERGIVRRLIWRVKAGDRSRAIDDAGGDLAVLNADAVFVAAREGDGVATSVVRDTAKYVGMAIANLAVTVDPEIVVLGGLLTTNADVLLEPVRLELARRLEPRHFEQLTVVASSLGEDAAALGAAHLAMVAARS